MKNFAAIQFLYPTAKFSMINDDVKQITWVGEEFPIPTTDQLQNAIQEMETAETEQLATQTALKESAKAKLIAGQPLTPEEAATIVI